MVTKEGQGRGGIRALVYIVFQGNRGKYRRVSRFLWRPRSNHSKPPFTRETEEGEGGDVGREWAEACAPLDVRGMKWNDDAWLIRCRPPTRIDNRVIRDNPPFLIEFQISLSLSLSASFNVLLIFFLGKSVLWFILSESKFLTTKIWTLSW